MLAMRAPAGTLPKLASLVPAAMPPKLAILVWAEMPPKLAILDRAEMPPKLASLTRAEMAPRLDAADRLRRFLPEAAPKVSRSRFCIRAISRRASSSGSGALVATGTSPT